MVAAVCLQLGSAVQIRPFPSPEVLRAPSLCSNENLDVGAQLKKLRQESKEVQSDPNVTTAQVKDVTARMAILKRKLNAAVEANVAANRITPQAKVDWMKQQDPADRPFAAEVLASEWMQCWFGRRFIWKKLEIGILTTNIVTVACRRLSLPWLIGPVIELQARRLSRE